MYLCSSCWKRRNIRWSPLNQTTVIMNMSNNILKHEECNLNGGEKEIRIDVSHCFFLIQVLLQSQ